MQNSSSSSYIMKSRLNVDKPLWSQETFLNRFRHFAWLTDPRNCLYSSQRISEAKHLLDLYRENQEPPNTSQKDILLAKKLVDSAYHPDSKEPMNLFGRMAFQVPGNMLITGAMLHFHRTNSQVVFWQWINQSFNSLVNYTNRNANSKIGQKQLMISYLTATGSAVIAALLFKRVFMKNTKDFWQRYVPFMAVATANCVNIPLTRQNEIADGVDIHTEDGHCIGKSKIAAIVGISQVVLSRIAIAGPGMILSPFILQKLERMHYFRKFPILSFPLQIILSGIFLILTVPAGCALFPQQCSMNIKTCEKLETAIFGSSAIIEKEPDIKFTYFNKGL